MKNFYLRLIIFVLTLTGTIGLFAQHVITEYSNINLENTIKYKHHFDENRYTKILDENGKKVFLQNQPITQNSPTEVVTLNVELDFDPSQFMAGGDIMLYNEIGDVFFAPWDGTNPITIDLPEGTYDVLARFFNLGLGKIHLIIKEQQGVTENTTISINPEDASNYISVNALNENGETLQPGVVNTNTGSAALTILEQVFMFVPINYPVFTNTFVWDEQFTGDPVWNFYINDIGDRYSIIHSFSGVGYEAGSYFTKFETLNGVSESTSLVNNPDNWFYHTEKFQPSLLGIEGIYPGFSTILTFNDEVLMGASTYNTSSTIDPGEAFKGFLNNSIDGNLTDFFVFPAIVDYNAILEPNPDELRFFIKGTPILKGENEVLYGSGASIYFGNGDLGSLGNDYYYDENMSMRVSLFHPRFSFSSSDNSDIKQGDNVPISNVGISNKIKSNYVGRYGEIRESDFFAVTAEVKSNGSVIFSGNYIDNGFLDYTFPETGNFEVTFTNTNIEVGGLAGKNTTKLFFDKSKEDAVPPTLQHLQFRNADGQVTDRFASASEGTVRLAGGDFKFTEVDEWGSGYYEYNEGNTVEFFYSPYNENNWTELELTEYPEYFQMPAFGDYYEASLSSIENTQENAWYDVRIICTDAAGNKQEQIISPAFKLNDTMGISEATKSDFTVYPNPFKDNLYIQLPETIKGNSTFRVTDLTGKTIHAENKNAGNAFVWNGSSLPKGIYILSIENNGKVIAKKVIKK